VVHLTEQKVRINAKTYGAGLYRMQSGIPQVIMSLYGPPAGEIDEEIQNVFADGRLFD